MVALPKFKDKLVKERISVGLDIGISAVKLVRLKCSKDTIELISFASESSELDLVATLRRIMQNQNTDRVNISVSGPAVIIRYVNFPKMKSDELKQSLKFEAQKHIPFPLEELIVDSHILKEDLPDNKMLVLLAAVRKDFLNQRMKIIEDAGLKVNLVDIDSICLINAFNFNYSQEKENIGNKAIALLNIGAAASNLDILEEGVPRLSRNINIAGNNFTQKLADALGSDFKSAENLKLNADADKIDRINTAVESTLTNLASEIRTSFDYYESQCAANVSKIFLSGGGSKIPGLKDMLKNLLGMEVESWDCLKQINISSNINPEEAKAFSNQLAVAVGLALRS